MSTSATAMSRALGAPVRILRSRVATPAAVINAWQSMVEAGRGRGDRERLAPGRNHGGPGNWLDAIDADECWDLLRGCRLGRIGFTAHSGRPVILPVNYAVAHRRIVIRSGRGPKLAAAGRGELVGFEADQIDQDAHTGWSVSMTGRARWVRDPLELARLAVLDLMPWVAGPRDEVIEIAPVHLAGRRLREPDTVAARDETVTGAPDIDEPRC